MENHSHNHDNTHCGGSCGHCHNTPQKKESPLSLAVPILGTIIFIIGFFVPDYAKFYVYIISYIMLAYEILISSIKGLIGGHIFDENMLMSIASIGAIAIGNYTEACAVVLLYQIGEFLQDKAVENSKKSISALMDIRPEYANVIRNGECIKVSPDEVEIGEEILVKPGEKIPLDGSICCGSAFIDTKALTGESLPTKVSVGDKVLSGSVNTDSPIRITVEKNFGESAASKILDMVQNAQSQKAPSEKFITKFAAYYTPVVVLLAVLIMLIPSLITHSYSTWIYRGLLFLVVSCPCALVISVPLGFFSGIGKASKNGILIKGGNYLEMLAGLDTVAFDKTGTLTTGEFTVQDINTNIDTNTFIELAAHTEYYSHHPIADSIKNKYGKAIDESRIKNYKEISGMGISAEIDNKKILLGNNKLIGITTAPTSYGTVIYMSIDNQYIGYLVINDALKKDSAKAIDELKKMNINSTVLSGDRKKSVASVCEKLGISSFYSELLPQDKVRITENLIQSKPKGTALAFVGDGINDAPVLVSADVGIAMGGIGSDSAIEAADAVIMTDEPSKIVTAIKIAKYTMKIIKQNIIFAIAVKLLIMLLSVIGATNMWLAIFGDVGVALLAILNSLRILKLK